MTEPQWKRQGFKSSSDYFNYLAQQKGFKSYVDERRSRVIQQGFKSLGDYQEQLVKKKGFKSHKEYQLEKLKEKGIESETDYLNLLAQRKGFESYSKLRESQLKKQGFESTKDYNKYITSKKLDDPNAACETLRKIIIKHPNLVQTVFEKDVSELSDIREKINTKCKGKLLSELL